MTPEQAKAAAKAYHDCIRAILASKVPARAKVVAVYLLDRQGDNGHAWPSWRTISGDCGMASETIGLAMAELVEAGILTKTTPDHPARGNTNQYSINRDCSTWAKRFVRVKRKRSTRVKQERFVRVEHNVSVNVPLNVPNNKAAKKFVKPTPQEVTDYARSIAFDLDGQHFIDTNDAKGWVVGKNRTPMVDWRACVRTWKHNDDKRSKETTTSDVQYRRAAKPERPLGGLQSSVGTVCKIA